MAKKPLVLIILDGFGDNKEDYGNAIHAAKTPTIDRILNNCPTVDIGASGMDVGLPDGQMGNSEVGHTNMGAGRVVYQDLTRITKAINDGEFFDNEVLVSAMQNCKQNNTALHIMGLLSDGGVHSHIDHLYGVVEMARDFGLDKVYIHAFTDGRDVPPTSGIDFVKNCEKKLQEIGVGKIADEFIVPTVCLDNATINSGDSVIFTNFRPDRAREITRSLVESDFDKFKRNRGYLKVNFVCMTQYDETIPNVSVAFKVNSLKNTLGEYISNRGLKQLRIAETEKYAHVTFFFNGGREEEFKNEDRALIKSPNVATYDLQPEMSAYLVTDEVVKRIQSGKYDVIILNYANCDMVGHTGVFDAAVKAVEAVDNCLARTLSAIKDAGGVAIITADHGNADKMYDKDGKPFTAHTTNPVTFTVVGYDCKLRDRGGRLSDIAPTMLEILGLEKPDEMTGESLILK